MNEMKMISFEKSIQQIIIGIFFLFTYLEIISLSAFPNFCGLLRGNSLILFSLIVMMFIGGILTPKTFRQILFWVVGVGLIYVNYHYLHNIYANIIYQIVILLSLPGIGIDFEKIVRTHLVAMLFGTSCVILLSLVGYLPKSGSEATVLFSTYQNTVFAFGFNHPNFLGALISFIIIEYTFLNRHKFNKSVVMISIIVLIVDFYLGAITSFLGLLVVLLGYILSAKKYIKHRPIFNGPIFFVPIFLSLFAFWIANQSGSFIFHFINKIVSSRPQLWSYYLTNFKVNWFGSNVVLNLNSGAFSTFGNGILDGSYIYLPMYYGWIGLLLFIISLYSIFLIFKETKEYLFLYIFFALSLMAFSENESSLFSISIFLIVIGYFQFDYPRRIKMFQ